MKLLFCLFKYFPFGGLQRDFLKIVHTCQSRGHHVEVLTMAWEDEKPEGLKVTELKVSKHSNHARARQFNDMVGRMLPTIDCDAVIGFNKMAGLDVYFAADTCLQANIAASKPILSKVLPRYKTFLELERHVFSPEAKTEILLLSPQEKDRFIKFYGTPEERFHPLPPGISKSCFRNEASLQTRQDVRNEHNLGDDQILLLMVGSAFKTKGVDRTLAALSTLPGELLAKLRLVVIGRGNEKEMIGLAGKLGIDNHVKFLGGRDDVPRYLVAADLLIHPARVENTGTVLVEALAAGLPILTTANCGYAFHVEQAKGGEVLPVPFDQETFGHVLQTMLEDPSLKQYGQNGHEYAKAIDVTSLHDKAVDIIEDVARSKS